MAIVIILIIAFWQLSAAGVIHPALAILMTVFGSLHCVFRLIGICVKAYKNSNKPKKTGIPTLDRFIE